MIDVVTTVRNGMPFLSEAIDSVRGQLRDGHHHSIVDDGSTDGTAAFLEHQENADMDVITTPPVGRGRALNLGWRSGAADLVAILDADDVASPCWLAEMGAVMAAHPEIAVLSCRGVLNRDELETSPCMGAPLYRLAPDAFLDRNPVHHSGALIRRSALIAAGGYDESRRSLFDYALWVHMLQLGQEIWLLDRGYVFKRIHARQHFEAQHRLEYMRGCLELRRQVSRDLLGGRRSLIPYLSYVYGLLPQGLRHWLRYRRHTAWKGKR